ncbi:MAG: protein kinase, partial [Deltaproteobacteria bacterium]|nr:protein kinase [Deltaproteobacteria bacterium]
MAGTSQRYQVLRHLATGGMAEIWLARQRGLEGFEKLVVLKRILPHLLANKEFIQMFVDEGRLAAQLSHPNIVQIFDLGKMNSSLFIAMEFVQGENLRYLQKRIGERGHSAMPVAYAAKVISQACEALYYAHTKADTKGQPLDLVHRDLSPANILLSYQGQVKIVDFGIAKAASHIRETRVGMVKGHYGYMSPEQCSGQPLDHRSDIFSLGIVLWEMITGQRLYSHETDLATVKAICETTPAKPSSIRANVPAELEAIVMRALEKKPGDRFKDCHRMHMALERFLHGQGSPITPVHLARFMKSLFPDRLEAWLKVIQSGGEAEFDSETVDSLSYVFNMGTPSQAREPAMAEAPAPAAPEEEDDEEEGEETRQVQVSQELLAAMTTKAPVVTDGVGPGIAPKGIHVEILVGDRVMRTVELPDEAVVGSGPRAHLRAAGDKTVAEKHAVLHRDGDTIMLTTTGGPVDVNGERVDFAVLGPEDTVAAGRFTFRVRPASNKAPAAAHTGSDATMVVDRPPELAADPLGAARPPLAEEMATDPASQLGHALQQPETRHERAPSAPVEDTAAREEKAARKAAAQAAKEEKARKAREEKERKAQAKAAARIEKEKARTGTEPKIKRPILPQPRPPAATDLDLSGLPPDGSAIDIYRDDPEDDDLEVGQPSYFPVQQIVGGSEVAALTLGDERVDAQSGPVAEVLHLQQEVVQSAAILTAGKKFKHPSERKPLAKMRKGGCRVNVPAGVSAVHFHGEFGQGDAVAGPASVDLATLDRLELALDDGHYRIRVFRPAAPPEAVKDAFATRLWATCAGLAAAAHFLGFFALVMVQTLDLFYLPVANTELAEQFAEGKLSDDKPKKKKPKKK